MNGATVTDSLRHKGARSDYSYKFQRLREKIRQAVAGGELSGKLPGERELARRFQVNAKTLSKALTDLAAEGLLSRSIGLGTFVKGADVAPAAQGRWLLLSDPAQTRTPLIEAIKQHNPDIQAVENIAGIRPSFLNQFSAVIDLSALTPQTFVRDLIVRNMPLVVVGREPGTYSTNAVLLDTTYLASRLGQDLLMSGHRRLAVLHAAGSPAASAASSAPPASASADGAIAAALRATISRYAPEATVTLGTSQQAISLIEQGVTGLVCDSTAVATEVMAALAQAAISAPRVVSVTAVGAADADYPCSGFYLSSIQEAEAISHLLQNARPGGGAVLWLTGKYIDRGTTGAASAPAQAPSMLTLTA